MRRVETLPQYIASIILAFLAFVTLIGAVSCVFLSATLLSQEYYLKQADQSTFAATALHELRESYRSYAAASGVDPAVLQSAIGEEQIRAALGQSIRAAFSGDEGYDYTAYAAALKERLVEYAAAQGIDDTPALHQALGLLVSYCTGSFSAITGSVIFDLLSSFAVAAKAAVARAAWVLAGMFLVCVATMGLMSRRLSAVLRNLLYVFGAVLVSAVLIPGVVQAFGFLQRLNLSPPSMKRYVMACAQVFFACYWYLCGVAAVLLGVCAVALATHRRRQLKSHEAMAMARRARRRYTL